jgi:hypothetical protein
MEIVGGHPDDWGFIPNFLDERDPRDARAQFNEKYLGGWFPFHGTGLSFDPKTLVMTYPGDPPFRPLSLLLFRDELLILYPASFVVVRQKDGSWEAARMD